MKPGLLSSCVIVAHGWLPYLQWPNTGDCTSGSQQASTTVLSMLFSIPSSVPSSYPQIVNRDRRSSYGGDERWETSLTVSEERESDKLSDNTKEPDAGKADVINKGV